MALGTMKPFQNKSVTFSDAVLHKGNYDNHRED